MRIFLFCKDKLVGLTLTICLALSACSGFEEQLIYNDAQRAHNKKKFDLAIQLYQKLLDDDPDNKIHPDNANIRYDLGVAYIDIGERQKAQHQVKELRRLKRADLAEQLEKLMMVAESL